MTADNLFTRARAAERDCLRAAGWVLVPLKGGDLWREPLGGGMYSEDEAVKRLERSERKEGGDGKQ